ncbi:hypothetical protein D6817_05265, partial [Candidatus Pacearchaeota archaeon]
MGKEGAKLAFIYTCFLLALLLAAFGAAAQDAGVDAQNVPDGGANPTETGPVQQAGAQPLENSVVTAISIETGATATCEGEKSERVRFTTIGGENFILCVASVPLDSVAGQNEVVAVGDAKIIRDSESCAEGEKRSPFFFTDSAGYKFRLCVLRGAITPPTNALRDVTLAESCPNGYDEKGGPLQLHSGDTTVQVKLCTKGGTRDVRAVEQQPQEPTETGGETPGEQPAGPSETGEETGQEQSGQDQEQQEQPPATGTCTLSNPRWMSLSTERVVDTIANGEDVAMVADYEGECEGHEITMEIYESDVVGDDKVDQQFTGTLDPADRTVFAQWTTEYMVDPGNDEYYFIIYIDGERALTSDELEVSEQTAEEIAGEQQQEQQQQEQQETRKECRRKYLDGFFSISPDNACKDRLGDEWSCEPSEPIKAIGISCLNPFLGFNCLGGLRCDTDYLFFGGPFAVTCCKEVPVDNSENQNNGESSG